MYASLIKIFASVMCVALIVCAHATPSDGADVAVVWKADGEALEVMGLRVGSQQLRWGTQDSTQRVEWSEVHRIQFPWVEKKAVEDTRSVGWQLSLTDGQVWNLREQPRLLPSGMLRVMPTLQKSEVLLEIDKVFALTCGSPESSHNSQSLDHVLFRSENDDDSAPEWLHGALESWEAQPEGRMKLWFCIDGATQPVAIEWQDLLGLQLSNAVNTAADEGSGKIRWWLRDGQCVDVKTCTFDGTQWKGQSKDSALWFAFAADVMCVVGNTHHCRSVERTEVQVERVPEVFGQPYKLHYTPQAWHWHAPMRAVLTPPKGAERLVMRVRLDDLPRVELASLVACTLKLSCGEQSCSIQLDGAHAGAQLVDLPLQAGKPVELSLESGPTNGALERVRIEWPSWIMP